VQSSVLCDLLCSKCIAVFQRKILRQHSAVLAAFRQFFIKTGEFEKKWSDDYEFVLDSRHSADYDLHDSLAKEDAVMAVAKAQAFVEEVEKWLRRNELL